MSLPLVTVLAARSSSRLSYVLDWLLTERLGLSYRLVHDRAEAATAAFCISYGWMPDAVSIHACPLLQEEGYSAVHMQHGEWNGLYALFLDEESRCDIPFDLLAGIFFLLTRYEEYGEFLPDRHGRYPAPESILYKGGVLERPVVDEWVEAFRLFLQDAWQITIPHAGFSWLPTYDIDIAWSYQHKGLMRNLGAGMQDLLRNRGRLKHRLRVLAGREQDPYNAFIWLAGQHMSYGLRPVWFFLAALRPSRFDKNIAPQHPRMSALIRAFASGSGIGLHPSYYTDRKPGRLAEEKAMLEHIIGRPVTISRQHYIRLRFPQTYRALIAAGISADYSMGYSTQLGFRAGTGTSFLWYDLDREEVTGLRIYPFAFMDTTARYDMGLSPEQALGKLFAMTEKLIAAHSRLITVFHNFSLGTDSEWEGWRGLYELFLRRMADLSGHE